MSEVNPHVPAVPPRWMPIGNCPELCSAGQWWDAIRVTEVIGRRAIEILLGRGGSVGPVILDPRGPEPRLYFLVPPGTTAGWAEPGTVPLGDKCHVVVPPATATEPPGLHWHILPRSPRMLTQAGPLRNALGRVRRERTGPAEATGS